MLVQGSELDQDQMCLLEVVPTDLLELHRSVGIRVFEPVHEPLVEVRAGALEQAVVRGLLDQDVDESEGLLPRERRPLLPDELLAAQRAERRPHVLPHGLGGQILDGAAVEHLAEDRTVLDDRPVGRAQPVEPRGDQGGDRRRDRERVDPGREDPLPVRALVERAVVDQHGEHLLHEERVAPGRGDDPLASGLVDERGTEEVLDDLGALVLAQRQEGDGSGTFALLGPVRMLVEQIASRRAHEHERRLGRVDDRADQVEEGLLGPVDVIDHDDERSLGGQRLEHARDRPERLLDREHGVDQTDRRADPLRHVRALRPEERLELGARVLQRVAVADPGDLPHDLGERPEGDAVAVGETAPTERCGGVGRSLEERTQEPGLPDARGTDHGRELGSTVFDGAGERRLEGGQVIRPPDHRRVHAPGDRLSVFQTRDVGEEEGGNRLGLPLEVERFDRLGVDEILHQAVGRVADQDLHRGRGRLQSRRRVDDVARDEVLACGDVAGDHLAGVDARAVLQLDTPRGLQPLVHAGQGLSHLPCRTHGAQGVVLVDPRQAEHRHDGVADVLLDRAAVGLQHGLHLVEVDVQDLAERFGIQRLAEGRGPLQVGEDDRDVLADIRSLDLGCELAPHRIRTIGSDPGSPHRSWGRPACSGV